MGGEWTTDPNWSKWYWITLWNCSVINALGREKGEELGACGYGIHRSKQSLCTMKCLDICLQIGKIPLVDLLLHSAFAFSTKLLSWSMGIFAFLLSPHPAEEQWARGECLAVDEGQSIIPRNINIAKDTVFRCRIWSLTICPSRKLYVKAIAVS